MNEEETLKVTKQEMLENAERKWIDYCINYMSELDIATGFENTILEYLLNNKQLIQKFMMNNPWYKMYLKTLGDDIK